MPTVSIKAGQLTQHEVEVLSPEEAGMHAGLSGETVANKDRLSSKVPIHPCSQPALPVLTFPIATHCVGAIRFHSSTACFGKALPAPCRPLQSALHTAA